MSEDAVKFIIFVIVMAIVGISKLVNKVRDSNPPPPRPPVPRRPQTQQPDWRTNSNDVKRFLDQLSQQKQPPSIAPPLAQPIQRPPPVPTASYEQHVESDEDEDMIAADARDLLQTSTAATHVERAQEIEMATRRIETASSMSPFAVGAQASSADDTISQSLHTPALASAPSSGGRTRAQAAPSKILRDYLRDHENARSAFILSEIFGTPKGMQDSD